MNTTRTTFTQDPEVGDTFTIDRPDWFATGTIVEVEPFEAITGHDGIQVTRAIDPNTFRIEVEWETNSAEIPGPFTTTIRINRG